MALFDFLKRKKEVEKSKKPVEKRTERALAVKEAKKADVAEKPKSYKKVSNFSFEIVKEPHISEKATNLAQMNQYVFKVYKNTNKPEVKKSVEGIYGVNVVKVNMIKIPKKKRRLGRTEGFRKGYVKAVVTIKEGQRIELF